MAHLELTGVSDDGKRLIMVSDAGVEFTLDIDPRLRSALSGDSARRMETQMDSTLRPRDIQTRIRAGETPEAVAQAAHTTVDKIMAFAAPVLAERQHVADRAQRSSVRRKSTESAAAGGARTLGDVVAAHLRSQNVDPDSVEWDAWRREDGRWALTGEYSSTKRKGSAQFTYDSPGNYVTADNEDARWLLGEIATISAPAPRDDLSQARQRRLSSVGEDELPLGVDAIELVSDPRRDMSDDLGGEQPLEAFLTDEPTLDETSVREEAADAAALEDTSAEPAHEPEPELPVADEPEPEQPVAEEPPPRRAVKKRGGRASVPSWDEIMFGGGKSD